MTTTVLFEGMVAEMVGIVLNDEGTLIALRLPGFGLILKLVHPSKVEFVK